MEGRITWHCGELLPAMGLSLGDSHLFQSRCAFMPQEHPIELVVSAPSCAFCLLHLAQQFAGLSFRPQSDLALREALRQGLRDLQHTA